MIDGQLRVYLALQFPQVKSLFLNKIAENVLFEVRLKKLTRF
jgi:hypothetical protein